MDEGEAEVRCCGCLPFLKSVKVVSAVVVILYLSVGLFLSFWGFSSPGLIGFAVVCFLLAALSLVYFEGLRRENDFLMLPFLVAEILLRVLIGFLLCFLWGTFVLACFDMILFNSPVADMTGPQFLFCSAVIATFVYAVFLRLFFPFYDAYRIVKKHNDHRRMGLDESAYMKISFTSRPTTV